MRQAYLTAVIILGHFRRIVLLGASWPPAEGLKGYAMKTYVTVGLTVLAGAALLETALIPGLLIGGVAVLAPRYLPKGALPSLRRRVETLAGKTAQRRTAPEASRRREPQAGAPQNVLPKFAIGQAVAKTITFRIIVTTLDFTTNYVVIGEFATAAGLSTYNLIAGPLFYLAHEAAWNYLGPDDDAVDLRGSHGGRAGGRWRARQPEQVHHQPGARQDHHVSRHCLDDGLRDQLRRGA